MRIENEDLIFEDLAVEVIHDEPLRKHTSFKVGGPCKAMVIPQDISSLGKLLKRFSSCGIRPFILGAGTNLLVSDRGMENYVVKISEGLSDMEYNGRDVRLGAGCKLMGVINKLVRQGYSGLEWLAGIPGTVGGGVYMNAGAYGYNICDNLEYVEILNWGGSKKRIKKKKLDFDYRHSGLESKGVVTGINLKLSRCDPDELRGRVEEILLRRESKQPLGYPSAGSVFKNPREDIFAGKLIDLAGLKGTRVGDASVSEIHANFIINLGKAKASDIVKLMHFIQEKVESLYGIKLETEIKIVGDFNED